MRIIEQFCDAYAIWDERSNVGDVYLTPIMQYLGGHARRGNDPHEMGEYEIADLRTELVYLADHVHMDAAFLVASLIRAVEVELIATSESYGKTLESLPELQAAIEQIFEHQGREVDEHVVHETREMVESAWSPNEQPATAPRKDQRRITDWEENMAPILDRDNLERARVEQWGEPG